MEELCTDIILGIDFMKLHSQIDFKMQGPQEGISVNRLLGKPCNVIVAEIKPQKFFLSISDCVPITTNCRWYSKLDKKFIKKEISKLLEERIIKLSHSS